MDAVALFKSELHDLPNFSEDHLFNRFLSEIVYGGHDGPLPAKCRKGHGFHDCTTLPQSLVG